MSAYMGVVEHEGRSFRLGYTRHCSNHEGHSSDRKVTGGVKTTHRPVAMVCCALYIDCKAPMGGHRADWSCPVCGKSQLIEVEEVI